MTKHYYKVGWSGHEDRDSVILSHSAVYSTAQLADLVSKAYEEVLRTALERAKISSDFVITGYSILLSPVADYMVDSLGFQRVNPLPVTCYFTGSEYNEFSDLEVLSDIREFNDSLDCTLK